MPANWELFKNGFSSFLNGKSAQSESDTARQIATLYVNTVGLASVIQSGALLNPIQSSIIENGFAASFTNAKTIQKAPVPSSVWLPAANSIITVISTATIQTMPSVLPTIAPTTGYVITNPGQITQLSNGISTAFQSGDATSVASLLASTFQTHLSTVSGLYNGLIPSPSGPVPSPPIPWSGIS